MATLARVYNPQKLMGQVYTPSFVVEKILDQVGFTGAQALGKSVLDPACGDGRFLTAVARRIVDCSPSDALAANLSCLHGWDVDSKALEACRGNLDVIAEHAGVSVAWHLACCDALSRKPEHPSLFTDDTNTPAFNSPFDFIVGNPPYIRIQHLAEEQRRFIQSQYAFCKSGSTDIYLAFFELAYHLLAPNGLCGFVTPNTYFYTQTAKACRDFFADQQSIKSLTNYGDVQVFAQATTYSAITIFGRQRFPELTYEKAVGTPHCFTAGVLPTDVLRHRGVWRLAVPQEPEAWQDSALQEQAAPRRRPADAADDNLEERAPERGRKLKDICRIHVGITTLCDKAYIFPVAETEEGQGEDGYVWADTKLRGRVKLESDILRPIVKGSTLKSGSDPVTQRVLFPYEKNAKTGKYYILDEAALQARFPLAYAYLLSARAELDRRDNGRPNPVAWYAFGRSQSLDNSWGRKIIFSPMNLRPNFILHEREDCTLYSGYFIKYAGDYRRLLDCLNSEAMQRFVAVSSRDFRGAWKAYSKKVIEDFVVDL